MERRIFFFFFKLSICCGRWLCAYDFGNKLAFNTGRLLCAYGVADKLVFDIDMVVGLDELLCFKLLMMPTDLFALMQQLNFFNFFFRMID